MLDSLAVSHHVGRTRVEQVGGQSTADGLGLVHVSGCRQPEVGAAVDGGDGSSQIDLVLARAGLARLGRLDEITETLDPLLVLPAPGQGALAVECRADDPELAAAVAVIDDAVTRAAVLAERSLLAALEAGCTAPVGGYAELAEGDHGEYELYLRGAVAAYDGSADLRLSATGDVDEAEAIGRRLAADLLDAGAADLMGRRQ